MSMFSAKVSQAASGVATVLNEKLAAKHGMRELDLPTMVLVAFGLLCLTVDLELSQLICAFVGALAYAAIESTKKATRKKWQKDGKLNGGKNKIIELEENTWTDCSQFSASLTHLESS